MAIKETIQGGAVVLSYNGNLMGGAESEEFHTRFKALRASGSLHVILDLSGVSLVSSAGIGMLVAGAKTLREAGGDLRLANLQDRTYNVLVVITRLGSVFNIYDTVDEAVASFKV